MALGGELTYTIRFQNTGTYLAERVVITDTLSSSLQWNTVRFVSSSHPCTWVLLDNGVLRFAFDQIMLPDSGANEPNSHGFVKFAMKPVSTLINGAQVSNIANIYFDYNAPVITNDAVFTVDNTSGTAEANNATGLKLWPDPVSDVLHLATEASNVLSVQIYDMHGRRVLHSGPANSVDVSALAAGIYAVHVTTSTATYVRSVVKR